MIKGRNKILILALVLASIAYFYKFSPKRIEFLGHYNKVFAHRVNSIEKQNQALKYFKGIEFDLVYLKAKDVLDVNHPPAESIGLTFENYLKNIKNKSHPFLWLDIKKLDTTNEAGILLKLNTLFELKKYPKSKVLIETLSPEALPKFTKAGYLTSYYLKPGLYKLKGEALIKEVNKIKSILELQPNIGISSSFLDYDVMHEFFPNKTKYVWVLSSSYGTKYREIRTILEDETVAVVLSKFRSFTGNR